MHTSRPPKPISKPISIRRIDTGGFVLAKLPLVALGAMFGFSFPLGAATWYLNAGQPSGTDWNMVSFWSATPEGNGVSPASVGGGDTFDTNGKILRTPAMVSFFGGAALVLNDSRLLLAHDTEITNTLTTSEAGAAVTLASTKSYALAVGTLLPVGKGIAFWVDKAVATFTVQVNTLTGDAPVTFGAPEKPGTVVFRAADASTFTGDIRITGSGTKVVFGNALNSGGTLILDEGTSITLGQKLTFNAVTIAGIQLPVGTHTVAQLNSTYAAFFSEGGDGSITVTRKRPDAAASLPGY